MRVFEGYRLPMTPWRATYAVIGLLCTAGGWAALTWYWHLPLIPGRPLDIWMIWLMISLVWTGVGARRSFREWGQGQIEGARLNWRADAALHGTIIREHLLRPAYVWMPRVVYPLILALFVGESIAFHRTPTLHFSEGLTAIYVVMTVQAWISPVYRGTLTFIGDDGRRRRVFITQFRP